MLNKVMKNQEKEEKKIEQARIDECTPIAWEILDMLIEAKPKLGSLSQEEHRAQYEPLTEKVMEHLLEKDIRLMDKQFIFQLLVSMIVSIETVVDTGFSKSNEMACAMMYEEKDLMDLRIGKINKILKS